MDSVHNVYVNLGASNHTDDERSANDFYATPPMAVRKLMKVERFNKKIWEPATGMNHITNILEENGYDVRRSDIIKMVDDDRIEIIDFLQTDEVFDGDIITNPPFNLAQEFVEKALESVRPGAKIAMFLKLQFLEGAKRYQLFQDNPPIRVWVSVNRLGCKKDGVFDKNGNAPSAICYCWYIWEKGYHGDPIIKWMK